MVNGIYLTVKHGKEANEPDSLGVSLLQTQ